MSPPHGIMFHHFHDHRGSTELAEVHPRGQGAICAAELDALIRHVGRDRILPAQDWQARAAAGVLRPGDLCLTFDDNLRCQFDVALPVLRHHGITAFWFVYTSVLQGHLERLELYRLFRTLYYPTINQFYDAFFVTLDSGPDGAQVREKLRAFNPANHLREFPFYTTQDRTFRYVRDEVLGERRYNDAMDRMMTAAGADPEELARGLWMDETSLRTLASEGHVIGLHSHTHPTRLGELSPDEQQSQYATNHAVLTKILGTKPTAMSHPCNSYSPATAAILQSLGIRLGFRANMAQVNHGPLEFPREDHANLVKRMAA